MNPLSSSECCFRAVSQQRLFLWFHCSCFEQICGIIITIIIIVIMFSSIYALELPVYFNSELVPETMYLMMSATSSLKGDRKVPADTGKSKR
jgi:hypothetical protein